VFNGTPTLAYCVSVSPGNGLTSPVYDAVSGKVFVSDGRSVFAFTPGPTSFTAAGSIQVAPATGSGSIIMAPIVDSTNGFVYVFSKRDLASTNAIVSQMPVSLASQVTANIGPTTATNVFYGAFDNLYFASGPASGSLYACGTQPGASAKPSLYTLTFQGSGVMNSAPAMSDNRNINPGANPDGACSPLTAFFDGINDRLFVGVGIYRSTSGGNQVTMWNINTRITSNSATPVATAGNELGGTSGISVDNVSSAPQASSIYFGTLAVGAASPCGASLYCAVKLTQSALQ
jgi:hypothetical protein